MSTLKKVDEPTTEELMNMPEGDLPVEAPKHDPKSMTSMMAYRDAKLASLINDILKSITKKEIKEMKTYQKFSALANLLPIAFRSSGGRGVKVTFNNIKIDSASTDDLEKGFIEGEPS